MKKILLTLSVIALLGVHLPSAHAQTGLQNLWVNGGLGVGGKGVAGELKLSCEVSDHAVSIRYVATEEIREWFSNGPTPIESTQDIALLYALCGQRTNLTFVKVSAGLGWVSGHRRGRHLGTEYSWFFGPHEVYEDVRFGTPGIALDIETGFTPLSIFGVGVSLIGNLNAESSYIGVLFSIQLGKVN
jgi:hypothetical protein